MTRGRRFASVLILCAVALVAVGVIGGQPAQTYAKAAQICMECIGLG